MLAISTKVRKARGSASGAIKVRRNRRTATRRWTNNLKSSLSLKKTSGTILNARNVVSIRGRIPSRWNLKMARSRIVILVAIAAIAKKGKGKKKSTIRLPRERMSSSISWSTNPFRPMHNNRFTEEMRIIFYFPGLSKTSMHLCMNMGYKVRSSSKISQRLCFD